MSESFKPSEGTAARTFGPDIINSIDVPIIAVGREFAISRFNPAAATLLSLTSADLGRPIRAIPILMNVKRLEELCGDAIDSGTSGQCDVRDATNGSWFVLRIAPYKGSEERIDGAVLTLQNVTAFRASLEQAIYEREYTKAIINTVIDPLVVLDDDCRVQAANQAFYTKFQISRDQAQGVRLYEIGSQDWEIPRLQSFLNGTPASDPSGAEFEHEFPVVGQRTVLLSARRLAHRGNAGQMILLSIQDITERKQREEARQRAEDELRDFVENATVGMHWMGPDGTVLWVNQGELDLLGYPREEFVGHNIAEFHADQTVVSDMRARLLRGEALHEFEARLRGTDGSIRHVLIDSSALFEHGRFVHTRCFTRDITKQKLAAKRLATQYALTRVLGESDGLPEAAPKLIRAVCETADWAIGALWRVDKTAGQLRCLEFVNCSSREVSGFEAATRSRTFALGVGLPGRVWSSGEPAWIPNVAHDGNFPRATAAVQDGLHGAFAFPVKAGNQVLGVMEFFSAEVRQPEPELKDLLTGFGNQIGEFAERKRAESDLRESGRRFREMVDALPAAVYTTDAEGRITHFNRAAVEFAGRVPELGTDRWCVTWKQFRRDGTRLQHDESPMAVALKQDRILDGVETVAERPDGKRRWFVPHPRLLRDAEGQMVGGINLLMDITERKQAELATALLAAIVDSSDDAIVSKNLDGIITSWNKGAEHTFGYSADEAVGRHISLIIPPDRQDEENDILRRLKSGDRIDHFETVRQRKDGTRLDISVTISPVKDSTGRISGASKVARDISQRKRLDMALRQSEERFRKLSETLDAEVRARTAELEERNREVLARAEQVRQLSWRVLRVQDDERRHIARELHDSAGQNLAVLGMNLASIAQNAKKRAPEMSDSVEQALEMVQELTKEIRTTSYLLHPPLLDENGLPAALSWYIRGLSERSGLDIAFTISEGFGRLPAELELVIFRLVQECVTNIHRHSGSKTASIEINQDSDRILIEVRDQGKGIPREKIAQIETGISGVGIRGMRERLRQFQGEMIVGSEGPGTTVVVTIPIPRENIGSAKVDPKRLESSV
jgi:PAS domain S-box-containing protein